jgi:uncharacterized protein
MAIENLYHNKGPASDRVTVRRLPDRGRYDRETIHQILDEAFVCHLGIVSDGHPFVIPTLYARRGESVFLHGSHVAQLLSRARGGDEVCMTVTLVDGLVLARSHFHHSINYRSVVVFGRALPITNLDLKREASRALVEHVVPGRWEHARQPSLKELKSTLFLKLDLGEASAKVRTGPPGDDAEDYSLPHWAGVLPIHQSFGPAQPDPQLDPTTPVPAHVRSYGRSPGTESIG